MPARVDYHGYMASRAWRLKRREVIEEQRGLCARCAHAPVRDVHHLSYKHLGNESSWELMGLCRPCHEYISAVRDDDPALSLIMALITEHGLEGHWIPYLETMEFWCRGAETEVGYLRVWLHDRDSLDTDDQARPLIDFGFGVVGVCKWY